MRIGTPKELKNREYRVGLTPQGAQELVRSGHSVFVETGAGEMVGFSDELYESAGCTISTNADELFDSSDMIIKVKEPQAEECKMLREDQVLFTYLHLAADAPQAQGLVDSGCIAIAYETVTGRNGRGLPLLEPMSEVAGRLSVQVGAYNLQKHQGGTGRLIGGVPGVKPAEVLIIGGGTAGFHAAQMATGLGANVTILERDNERQSFAFMHPHFNDVDRNLISAQGLAISSVKLSPFGQNQIEVADLKDGIVYFTSRVVKNITPTA